MYAQIIDDQPVPLAPGSIRDAEGTQHPRSILTLWSEAELAAIGIHPIVEPPPLEPNQVEVSSELVWNGSGVERVRTVRAPTAEEQAARAAELTRQQRMQDARAVISAGPPPQTLPGLAARLAAVELLLGLRDA